MKTVLIFKKELKAYFSSPLFYVLAFVLTLFLSARFLPSVYKFAESSSMPESIVNSANIHVSVFMVHLNLVYLLMLFLTPLLTMKLFSEEKKDRTIDLLLTAPVTSTQIVVGKFLAVWSVVTLLLFLALLYPLSLGLISTFDYAPLWSSYLGMFLMLGVNCAIGVFASALTSSSLIATFLGVLMILAIMLVGSVTGSIVHPFWYALMEQLSMVLHIRDFFDGTLETSGVIFFITSICLFCFLTQRLVESSRWR